MNWAQLLAKSYEETRIAFECTETKASASEVSPILQTMLLEIGGRLMLYHPDLAMEVLKNLKERRGE